MRTVLVSLAVCANVSGQSVSAPLTNQMLHASGTRLVDGQGRPVILRGVNLGGWLIWEGWTFGGGFDSETTVLKGLNTLAGAEAVERFRGAIYSNFISAEDLQRIAALGFNSVRVPINYRAVASDPESSGSQTPGWAVLDRLFDWCGSNHLYVILDLHAAPGGQAALFTADPGDAKKSLWQSPEHQGQTIAIWHALARRYKNRQSLAGYDLLNEPAPWQGRAWLDLAPRLVNAVREEDKEHLIILEGGSLATDFSMFRQPLDSNMAYSFHIYTWFGDDRTNRLKNFRKVAETQRVPMWIGEFGENTYRMIGTTREMFEQEPDFCGWCFWEWKRVPSKYPGLTTVTPPADWQHVMDWINHPLWHRMPSAEETRRGMDDFVKTVQGTNVRLDQRMLRELLPSQEAK